jgi:hypothetical protein
VGLYSDEDVDLALVRVGGVAVNGPVECVPFADEKPPVQSARQRGVDQSTASKRLLFPYGRQPRLLCPRRADKDTPEGFVLVTARAPSPYGGIATCSAQYM